MIAMASGLEGHVVALPETRQLDVLAGLVERRGARVWRCPLVAIHDAPDAGPVNAWLKAFVSRPPDDLVLLTGEGLRRMCGFAERAAMLEEFVGALGRTQRITRGPKPVKALKEIGLDADLQAGTPTTSGVIETLREVGVAGRDVAVQLYGTDPNRPLMDFLDSQGVRPRIVAPYVYASASEDAEVSRLIRALIDGEIDVVAFTSQPQVRRLFGVARKDGTEAQLAAALARTVVGVVGPVVAAALADHGVAVDVMPESAYFMKPLVAGLEKALAGEAGTADDD